MKHQTSERTRVGAVHQPEAQGSLRCRVCLKAVRPDDRILEVAYRGAHYPVRCRRVRQNSELLRETSCQLIERSPGIVASQAGVDCYQTMTDESTPLPEPLKSRRPHESRSREARVDSDVEFRKSRKGAAYETSICLGLGIPARDRLHPSLLGVDDL